MRTTNIRSNTMLAAKLDQSTVIDVYRKTAPLYDVWAYLTETRPRRLALEAAAIRNGEAILEVAVGTGLTFREILRRNPDGENYGIDLTDAMLARARRKAAQVSTRTVHLSVGDAYSLPFADGTFDLLVNSYMFDLLPEEDFPHVLAEFKRVLKPNGRLLLTNMAQPEGLGEGLYEAIYRLKPEWMGGCRGVSLSAAVRTAGFEQVQRQRITQMRFPSEIISARLANV
jgi:ubiquinone/menaquinone biosynthesis C-methylase UbiE